MLAKMFKTTSAEQLSLSKISAAWHSASWLWGLQPNYFNCSLTASCSACAMLVSMGELEMWLADMHVVVHALAAEQTACRRGDKDEQRAQLFRLSGSTIFSLLRL